MINNQERPLFLLSICVAIDRQKDASLGIVAELSRLIAR